MILSLPMIAAGVILMLYAHHSHPPSTKAKIH